jgi:hypothetical protein
MMDVRYCIEKLRSEGFTDRRVERVLDLDKRFLARAHHMNVADEASTALLRVLASFPFMVQIAETGYDTEASEQIQAMWVSLKLSEVLRRAADTDTLVVV